MFIDRIENEIRYTSAPCEEIIGKIADDKRFGELTFLQAFKLGYSDGTFEQRFCSSIEKAFPEMLLSAEDVNMLKEFCTDLGTTDIEGQIANCRLYRKLLSQALSEARSECDQKCRLYRSLSVMGAAAVAVILI